MCRNPTARANCWREFVSTCPKRARGLLRCEMSLLALSVISRQRSKRSLLGGFCCKSRFALVVGNSAGRRCAFRVRMWGASSPHVKLTGDFANVSDAIRIGDCFPFRNFAKNSSPCNFRLLQQYRPDSCRGCRRPARQLMTEADSRTAANGIEKIRVARLWRGRLTPATSSISSQGGCSRRAGSRPILHERWRRDGSRRPLAP
jgi:hypothetical protein